MCDKLLLCAGKLLTGGPEEGASAPANVQQSHLVAAHILVGLSAMQASSDTGVWRSTVEAAFTGAIDAVHAVEPSSLLPSDATFKAVAALSLLSPMDCGAAIGGRVSIHGSPAMVVDRRSLSSSPADTFLWVVFGSSADSAVLRVPLSEATPVPLHRPAPKLFSNAARSALLPLATALCSADDPTTGTTPAAALLMYLTARALRFVDLAELNAQPDAFAALMAFATKHRPVYVPTKRTTTLIRATMESTAATGAGLFVSVPPPAPTPAAGVPPYDAKLTEAKSGSMAAFRLTGAAAEVVARRAAVCGCVRLYTPAPGV